MVKIITNKKKLTPLIAIVLFILLGAFNISSGIAIHMHGDGATFNLDKADPVEYGVYIPTPNTYTTMAISGSNQGEFVAMDWLGVEQAKETVDYPGNDVSYAYPKYFEDYIIDSTTLWNDYINPWKVEWLNVSAYGAENDTLSPFTFNTVFNYYVMAEESELTVPINNSMPMQIDLLISSGPKMLKLDWLLNNPENDPLNNLMLMSPSGQWLSTGTIPAMETGGDTIFRYIPFVADESGTYRLLIDADYAAFPGYLNLEFLDFNLKDLAVNKVSFVGDGDEWPSVRDEEEDEWDAEWYKFSGNKGDKYTLDFGYDYKLSTPFVNMFAPKGDILYGSMTPGIYDIYFPETGNVYISFTDIMTSGPYLASLYLKEIPIVEYNIGGNITNIRVSRDQRKAIDFTIELDSVVRFNYTEWGDGDAKISSMGADNGFIFKDAKNLYGYSIFGPLETKSAGTMDFYYYYFPAGEYEAIILNDDPLFDSVLQISSEIVYNVNTTISTIPITSLSYPLMDATSSLTAQFQPDAFYSSLKQAQVFDINIAETGQYKFNWSILASDNLAQIPTMVNPSYVLLYNDTGEGQYIDYTTISHTYLQSFDSLENPGDYLYIAYPSKWHDIELNLTTGGSGGDIDLQLVESTSGWIDKNHADNTGELDHNGSLVMSLNANWMNWIKGVDSVFDIEGIDEDDYYWVRLECWNDYQTTIPEIDLISLSNVTIHGDVNFALVRDSGYNNSDFWTPTAPTSETGIIINQESAYDSKSFEEWLFGLTVDPCILGLEAGNYKLLVIPEQWSHPGSLGIRFAIEDYWGYHVEQSFTIPGEPLAHTWQIGNMVNVEDRILYNYSTYPYDFSISFNETEVAWLGGAEALIAIKCYGNPYSWTQLVVGSVNVTDYELYILQDLPWLSNSGPNQELIKIADGVGPNNTIEFGVIRDNFTLILEILCHHAPNEMVTLDIGIRQYNTTAFYGSEIVATYTPPVPGLDPLVLTLMIAIPAAIGVVVVIVYVVKKRKP